MAQRKGQRTSLRRLLMGPPLSQREEGEDTEGVQRLNEVLRAVKELLPQVYGEGIATEQASMELQRVIAMDASYEGMACKRASVLFAMVREQEVAAHFVGGEDPAFAADLRDRVLPFATPRFVRHSFQTPDAFVVLTNVLAEMWAGERLGNWPLQEPCAEEGKEEMQL